MLLESENQEFTRYIMKNYDGGLIKVLQES